MAKFVALNNVEHKDLRVIRDHAVHLGDNEMSVVTFPQEFRAIQNEYPIFFQKNGADGKFYPVALLGLREGENLFLTQNGWDAQYVPASVKRRPFLIGTQENSAGNSQAMVYIDMDSPRLSNTDGDPVFLPHGGYSPYLETMVDLLDYIQYGAQLTEEFTHALLKYDLLEVVSLDITLQAGEKYNLAGIYTINEEKLAGLDDASAGALLRSGYLEYLYMVLASHANVNTLIARIESRLSQ